MNHPKSNDEAKQPVPGSAGPSAGEEKRWGRGAESALQRMRKLERAKAEEQGRNRRPRAS